MVVYVRTKPVKRSTYRGGPAHAILRLRLFEQLDHAQENDIPLILVSAPPGFGKSTLISAWSVRTQLPLVWLLLDETDNDPDGALGESW
jgi:ATP/maltotriose-dependent transcriptional regulator MalT